jgi:hypothetical protein
MQQAPHPDVLSDEEISKGMGHVVENSNEGLTTREDSDGDKKAL